MSERRRGFRAGWIGAVVALAIAAAPELRAQSRKPPSKGGRASESVPAEDLPPAAEETTDKDGSSPTPRTGGLRMSRAVVCESIDGFENYKALAGAAQTSDEKLLIYYRPLRYKTDYVNGLYRAHLVQDNEIRKRGRKEVVRQKKKVVEYDPKSKDPLGPIFIRNTISLKGLEPGDYDLTVILYDQLDKGAPPSKQIVKFRVIPAHDTRNLSAKKKEDPPADP